MATGRFVSYLRVSTQKQGRSGLGLEAQREAVAGYLDGGKWKLVEEVVEVESGKNSDRPELAKALSLCRLHRATLIVAKLDRLARNVAFISALMEAGVKFQAVDMPDVNDMVVHILASVAQGEAKAVSDRTKAALAAAKARGTQLGGLRWNLPSVADKGRIAALKVRRQARERYTKDVLPIIEAIKAEIQVASIDGEEKAVSLRQIASALNERGITTARGGEWSAVQVQRIMDR